MDQYPTKLIQRAVEEISRMPGIGKKSALRIALHLLKKDVNFTKSLSEALIDLREKTQYCNQCGNLAEADVCNICNSSRRDPSIICIVEDSRDVMAIENTAQFNGLYHVLGGVLSPIEGIGPDELNIESLFERLKEKGNVAEIILALSPTMEGDTTSFYLSKKLKSVGVSRISSIARGIPIGGELEYTDEITLGRSILSRRNYNED